MPLSNKKSSHIIKSFEAKALKKRPPIQKLADLLTTSFGTVWFLLINIAFFVTWMMVNTGKISSIPVFDPYPFVLLITFVSLEAIILAIIVLISQNRESQIGNLRDELQLQVELISEKEISKVLLLLQEIIRAQKIKISDPELEEMLKEVNTSYIERKLNEQIHGSKTPITKKAADSLFKAGEKIGENLTSKK